MKHNSHDGLDRARIKTWDVPEEILVVPDFVSIVGSVAEGKNDGESDVDVLIRSEADPDGRLLIWPDSIFVPLRKALDPDKEGYLHFTLNPQGPHATYEPLYDLVLRRKGGRVELKAVSPGSRYTVMKPRMAVITDAFSVDELWPWVEKWLEKEEKVLGSPKIDGYRAVISAKNGKSTVWFEDAKETRTPAGLPNLSGTWVIEGEYTAKKDGKWLPRPELMAAVKDPEAKPHFWVYDCLYAGGEDISQKPFLERMEAAKKLNLPKEYFTILPQWPIRSRADLERDVHRAHEHELSEGLFVRIDGPYVFGATDTAAKLKFVLEVKVLVLGVTRKENGYIYHCGLADPGDFTNTVEFHGKQYVDLGNTFVSKEKLANEGDILNVVVEEIGIARDGDQLRLYWGKPTPMGPDRSRKTPYTAQQVIDMARRRKVLKGEKASPARDKCMLCDRLPKYDVRWANGKGRAWFCERCFKKWEAEHRGDIEKVYEVDGEVPPKWSDHYKALGDEGETRAEAAAKFWADHWHESYPKSGKGRFVYQHHWRGLSEDEIDWDEARLLETDHSVHGDLRFSFDDALWGFTVFLGRAADVRKAGGDRLANLPADDALQGQFKLHQPKEWLDVGKRKPYVSEPGEVGATSDKYAKFFAIDWGTYEIGVWREHFFEVFLNGRKLKGRYLIQYAPVGRRRTWLIKRPKDQTPYAETHDRKEVLRELAAKGQKWLIWARPGQKPEKVEVKKMAKSVNDLKRAIQTAVRAVKDEKWDDAAEAIGTALEALNEVQDELGKYGYAYGYAEPKAQDTASVIKKALQAAKRAVGKQDAQAALDALQQALDALSAKKMWSEFKVFKRDGQTRWLTISSGGFEDREGEIVSTAFLESAVKEADESGDRGPLLIYHVPGARIGECDFQAVVGGLLLESGAFDDTPAGQAAAKYLEDHADEYGVSIGFLFKNRTPDGVYEPPGAIVERSVLPREAAAFPWSAIEIEKLGGDQVIDERKREELVKILGEDEAERVLAQVEEHAKALREAGIRFKEKAQDERESQGDEGTATVTAGEYEVVISEEALVAIADMVNGQLEAAVKELKAQLDGLRDVVEKMAQAEEERLAEKARNLPRATLRRLGRRPTRDNPAEDETNDGKAESLVERGLKTLYG